MFVLGVSWGSEHEFSHLSTWQHTTTKLNQSMNFLRTFSALPIQPKYVAITIEIYITHTISTCTNYSNTYLQLAATIKCRSLLGSLGPSTVTLIAWEYVAYWIGSVSILMVTVSIFPVEMMLLPWWWYSKPWQQHAWRLRAVQEVIYCT